MSLATLPRRPREAAPIRFAGARAVKGPVADVEWFVWLAFYSELEGVSLWDVALWDDAAAVWAGAPEQVNLACDVISISINAGRDEPLARFRPASAVVAVSDPDGTLSPWITASDPDAFATVRPGITLSIEARHVPSDVTYPVYTGTVMKISDTFPNFTDHVVTFNCADALQVLAAYDGLEQPPAGAGEHGGDRIQRILEMVSWRGDRVLDVGVPALQETTLAQNALNEAGLVTDTELGALFVRPDGVMRFLDRNGIAGDPHYTQVQFTFGEVEPELCYAGLELLTDADLVRNVISISNTGGTAVTHADTRSIGLHGPRTYQRFDLIHQDPAQSDIIADQYLAFFADASRRIESLELVPSVNTETIIAALSLQLLWRIQVRRRATGFQVIADLQVQGIEHQISAGEWKTTLKTFSASAVLEVGRWQVGRWDSALWAF